MKEELIKLYPELVYKFYFIATLFEVLTIYDISEVLKEEYFKKAQEALK